MARTKNRTVVLAGDIGGTKTNLGLFRSGGKRPVCLRAESFSSRSASGLSEIVKRFLENEKATVRSACFGIAGPVINGVCRTTNLPWVVSEKRLANRFGWEHVRLLNDLAATGLGVPLLRHDEFHCLNDIRPNKRHNMVVVAPGTGLGKAIVVYRDGEYWPVAGEGGHVDFGPANPEQADLWRYLFDRFGHVSHERILCGSGLVNIYEFLRDSGRETGRADLDRAMADGDHAPRQISEGAIEKKIPICRHALDLFVDILGSVSGDLALTVLAEGGLYVGGGIPPKILPALDSKRFLSAFRNKGRFAEFLDRIPVRVILNDRTALLGAAAEAIEAVRHLKGA